MSRIAIVTPEYPGMRQPSFGGIAAQYGAMAPALAALGDEVHVLVPGAVEAESIERNGVTVHAAPIRSHTGPLLALARCAAARRTLDGLGAFDTVLVSDWSGNGALLPTGPDEHVVTHLHTSLSMMLEIAQRAGERRDRPTPRARLQLWLERRQVERSRAILGCSQAIVSLARRHWNLDGKPTGALPNVVDPERIIALAKAGTANLAVERGSPVIVCPGRLEARKGPQFLVRAMEAVWAEHPAAIVVLAGNDGVLDGKPAPERIRELAGDRAGSIYLTGPLDHLELFPTFAAADVVVTPSLWEAFGIVTLEAMVLGKRVVATRGSGFEEFCEDGRNAILTAPADADALADGILRALSSDSAHLESAAVETGELFSAKRRGPEYRDRLHALSGG